MLAVPESKGIHRGTVFNCMITPQDFHHRNLLISKLTNLSIYNGHRILFICQILANLILLRVKYMGRIGNVLPQHWHMKHWMNLRDNSGGNTNLYNTSPTLDRISKGSMYLGANLPFLSNLITPFIVDTLRNTKSSTENDTYILLRSALSCMIFFLCWCV